MTKQKCKAAPQISFDTSTGTGSYLPFSGPLLENPAILVIDNQSNVAVTISDDGVNDFKTFSAAQGLSLDLPTNRILNAAQFSWPIGTQFQAKCSEGIGFVYISYVYAT